MTFKMVVVNPTQKGAGVLGCVVITGALLTVRVTVELVTGQIALLTIQVKVPASLVVGFEMVKVLVVVPLYISLSDRITPLWYH